MDKWIKRGNTINTKRIPFRSIKSGMCFKINGIWYESLGIPHYKDKVWKVACAPMGVTGKERTGERKRYITKAMRAYMHAKKWSKHE